MSKAYNKIIAIVALIIIGSKANAENNPVDLSDDKVAAIYNEILSAAKSDRSILENIFGLQKSELENALEVALTDSEFATLHSLIGKLISEGVEIHPTSPGKMVIATQEYAK